MSKTKLVTISPLKCPKGHVFYPKVLPDGTVKNYVKCPERFCRAILDRERVKQGILARSKHLNTNKKPKPVKPIKTVTVNFKERPHCTICNITFYDQKNLETHNQRLHRQR